MISAELSKAPATRSRVGASAESVALTWPSLGSLNSANRFTTVIETAIGEIPINNPQALALFFLRWGMGLAGAIALILMVIASYMVMTSSGIPQKLGAGKELLTAALSGLILLVLSAWLLNFIGVKILNIF